MTTFKDLQFKRKNYGGIGAHYKFDNGITISVQAGPGNYSTPRVKYSKSNDTYQVWLGDEIVTDFATKEKANAEAKRLNVLQDVKRVDKAQMKEDLDLGHQKIIHRLKLRCGIKMVSG